jgi:hypothetical protein
MKSELEIRVSFFTPQEGNNMIRILPAYPRTEEDFFLENRERGWVLMNIVDFTVNHPKQSEIQVWKTDVDVLYIILNIMTDPIIRDITHLERGRLVNVYLPLAISKQPIKIYPAREKQPLPWDVLGNITRDGLPNLEWVDRYLSNEIDRKSNKYRRIDLG